MIKEVTNTVPWTYVIKKLCWLRNYWNILLKRTKNQQGFRIEKVIKRKINKLYVKSKGYNDSFNSWIDKKDLIKWNSPA